MKLSIAKQLSLAVFALTSTGLATVQSAHAGDKDYVTFKELDASQKQQDDREDRRNSDNRKEFDELRRSDVDSDNWHNSQNDKQQVQIDEHYNHLKQIDSDQSIQDKKIDDNSQRITDVRDYAHDNIKRIDDDQVTQNGRIGNLEADMKKNYGEHQDLERGITQAKDDAKDARKSSERAQKTANTALDLGNSNQNDIDKNTRDISHNTKDIADLKDRTDEDRETTKSRFDQVKEVQDKDRQASKDQTAKTAARQDETDRRVGKLRDRVDGHDKDIGTLKDRADATDQTLADHNDKLENHEGRITTLEDGQVKQDQRIGNSETNITNLQNGQKDQDKRISENAQGVKDNKSAVERAQKDATDAGKIADRADDRSLANRNRLNDHDQHLKSIDDGQAAQDKKIQSNADGVAQAKADAAKADRKADDAYDYTKDVDRKATEAGNSAERANGKADANTDRLNSLAPTVADNTRRVDDLEDGQKAQDKRMDQSEADTRQEFDTVHGDIHKLHGDIEASDDWHNAQNDKQQVQIDSNKARLDQNDIDQKAQDDRIAANTQGLKDNFAEHKVLDKKATDAQTTADGAVADAARAQSDANKGIADAATAQAGANEANGKADTLKDRVDGHDGQFARVDAEQKVQDGKIDGLSAEQIKHNQLINQNAAAAAKAQGSADTANRGVSDLNGRADKADAKFSQIDKDQVVQDQRISDSEAAVLEAQSTADAGVSKAEGAQTSADTANAGVTAANGRLDNHNGRITTLEGQTATNAQGVKDAQLVAGKASSKADAAQIESANANIQSRNANAKAGVALENTYINSDRIDALNGRVGEGLKTAEHNAVSRSNAYTDQKVEGLNSDIKRNRKEANDGIASVAAMANIQQVPGKEWSVGIGAGHYSGSNAVSLGAIKQIDERSNLKFTVGTTGNNTAFGAGYSIGW